MNGKHSKGKGKATYTAKAAGEKSLASLRDRLPPNAKVEEVGPIANSVVDPARVQPQNGCPRCISIPCVCDRDALEAAAEQAVKAAKLPSSAVTYTLEKGGWQHDFTRISDTEVLVQKVGPKFCERRLLGSEEARTVYRALLQEGWRRF